MTAAATQQPPALNRTTSGPAAAQTAEHLLSDPANKASWPVYSPEQDVQGSTWARERDAQREGALARRAAWQRERQDSRDELKAQVWLSADVSRRLRAIAARTGFEPEQVLAQLADRVRMDDDGALTVDAFTPR
ncbi:hypothetical protein [Streptomyces phaeochromogenes]|uniref:hypothetical protein n=1 Tax=Streptomyces phaeochromogenes TaxID=1923 RepID=UPI00386EDA67|nr:hypothetical protein OG478_00435 [Streptomyces phaeochromogenes]WSW11594.1 hypothetical protein OG277_00245 [Streptomyces phaeochromogenes]